MGSLFEYVRKLFKTAGSSFTGHDDYISDNEYLRSKLTNTENIMYSVDTDFNIKWLNKYTSELYPDADGKKCFEVFANSKIPCPDCYCSKALSTGQVQKSVRHLNYAPTIKGKGYWESIQIPIFDKSKQVTGALTISQEIEDTERMKDELLEKK